MAKIAFFVLFALVAVHLTSAGRITREEPPKAAAGPQSLEELLNQIQGFIKENVNAEQLEKFKEIGESLGEKTKKIFEEAGTNLQKLGEKST